jgi:hypothetical protein
MTTKKPGQADRPDVKTGNKVAPTTTAAPAPIHPKLRKKKKR